MFLTLSGILVRCQVSERAVRTKLIIVETITMGLNQAYRGHLGPEFEALLLAQGWPWVEEGKQALLLEFVSD